MGLQLSSLDRDFTSQFAQLVNKSLVSSVKKISLASVKSVQLFGPIERAFAAMFGPRSVNFRLNVYGGSVPTNRGK